MDPNHDIGRHVKSVKWKPSPGQLQILERSYKERNGSTPHKADLEAIIATLTQHGPIAERNVTVWFPNRRTREKTKQGMVPSKDEEASKDEDADVGPPHVQPVKWKASPGQLQILKHSYEERNGSTPRKADLEAIITTLAQHGPIAKKNVIVWFQNRRRAEKEKQPMVSSKDEETDIGPPSNHNTSSLQWRPSENQVQILENLYDQGNGTIHDARLNEIIATLSEQGPIRKKSVRWWFANRNCEEKRKQGMLAAEVSSTDREPDVWHLTQNTSSLRRKPSPNQLQILDSLSDQGNAGGNAGLQKAQDGPIAGIDLILQEKSEQGMVSSDVSSRDEPDDLSSKGREPDVCPPNQSTASLRWRPSPDQLKILENLYDQGIRTPLKLALLKQITAKLSQEGPIADANVILRWFRNRRYDENVRKQGT